MVSPLLLPPHCSSSFLPRQARFYCINRCVPARGCLSFMLGGLLVPLKDCLRSPPIWCRLGNNPCTPEKESGRATVLCTGLTMLPCEDPLESSSPLPQRPGNRLGICRWLSLECGDTCHLLSLLEEFSPPIGNHRKRTVLSPVKCIKKTHEATEYKSLGIHRNEIFLTL